MLGTHTKLLQTHRLTQNASNFLAAGVFYVIVKMVLALTSQKINVIELNI